MQPEADCRSLDRGFGRAQHSNRVARLWSLSTLHLSHQALLLAQNFADAALHWRTHFDGHMCCSRQIGISPEHLKCYIHQFDAHPDRSICITFPFSDTTVDAAASASRARRTALHGNPVAARIACLALAAQVKS